MPLEASDIDGTLHVACGTTVPFGCTLMYSYVANAGCNYHVYDSNDNCIAELVFDSTPSTSLRGGGFTIETDMSYIRFSENVKLSRSIDMTVESIIRNVGSLDELHSRLDYYNVNKQHEQDIINIYLDQDKTNVRNDAWRKGDVYLSTIETDPASVFGGTWRALTGVFPDAILAWEYTGDTDETSAVVDIAIADKAICV